MSISGWAVLFHPDLLHGTTLEKTIREYSFFDYHINEALHMSREERVTIVSLIKEIEKETDNNPDEMQDSIIVGYLDVLLRFCQRFYNRQFLTRRIENNDVLARFESALLDYYKKNMQEENGVPDVRYLADVLCMSPNYLGDLIKRMTGETAGSHIRRFIVRVIKNNLASGLTVSEVAYKTGFDYTRHLSRFFRKQTGLTPSEYLRQIKA